MGCVCGLCVCGAGIGELGGGGGLLHSSVNMQWRNPTTAVSVLNGYDTYSLRGLRVINSFLLDSLV